MPSRVPNVPSRVPLMPSRVPIVAGALLATIAAIAGCGGGPPRAAAVAEQPAMFAPREVRIHPVFTKVIDWSGDGTPDGVEALVELHDQFGDPSKGAGLFTFELFHYAPGQPDPRGGRVCNPWQASVATEDEQRARWSKTGRSYAFRLQADRIAASAPYVFAVTFSPADGGPRLFDRVVLGSLTTRPTHTDRRNDVGDNSDESTPPSTGEQRLPNEATSPVR